jgi:antitoxin StbD
MMQTLQMQRVEAANAVSVSAFKKSPTAYVEESNGEAIALLNHNRVIAYMVPAARYEELLEIADNLQLAQVVRSRANEIGVPVNLDDL